MQGWRSVPVLRPAACRAAKRLGSASSGDNERVLPKRIDVLGQKHCYTTMSAIGTSILLRQLPMLSIEVTEGPAGPHGCWSVQQIPQVHRLPHCRQHVSFVLEALKQQSKVNPAQENPTPKHKQTAHNQNSLRHSTAEEEPFGEFSRASELGSRHLV